MRVRGPGAWRACFRACGGREDGWLYNPSRETGPVPPTRTRRAVQTGRALPRGARAAHLLRRMPTASSSRVRMSRWCHGFVASSTISSRSADLHTAMTCGVVRGAFGLRVMCVCVFMCVRVWGCTSGGLRTAMTWGVGVGGSEAEVRIAQAATSSEVAGTRPRRRYGTDGPHRAPAGRGPCPLRRPR